MCAPEIAYLKTGMVNSPLTKVGGLKIALSTGRHSWYKKGPVWGSTSGIKTQASYGCPSNPCTEKPCAHLPCSSVLSSWRETGSRPCPPSPPPPPGEGTCLHNPGLGMLPSLPQPTASPEPGVPLALRGLPVQHLERQHRILHLPQLG